MGTGRLQTDEPVKSSDGPHHAILSLCLGHLPPPQTAHLQASSLSHLADRGSSAALPASFSGPTSHSSFHLAGDELGLELICCYFLRQCFSSRDDSALREHWTMSGDTFGCHSWERARDAAKTSYHAQKGPAKRSDPTPNVKSAGVEKPLWGWRLCP